MKVPDRQPSVSAATSAQPSEPVGRTRANAGPHAWKALKQVITNRASATEHCKQSLSMAKNGDSSQGLQGIKSQNPVNWTKVGASRPMLPQQGSSSALANHRFPETVEMPVLETFNPGDTFDSTTLPTAKAVSGNQALHDVKSQSSGWIKSLDDRVLPPNLSFDRPIGSHRSPELARGKMTVKEVRINTSSQLAAAKMPWHPEKSDADSVVKKNQMPPSFIDSSNYSDTPPPVAHKIEITEMQKPQRAVFKNTNPAPEIAQGKMSFQTRKIDESSERDPPKMPTQPTNPDAGSDSEKCKYLGKS